MTTKTETNNQGTEKLDEEESQSQKLQNDDEIDSNTLLPRFGIDDVLCILFSLFMYSLDVGTDIYVAYMYYTKSYWVYFALTLVFVVAPALAMTALSLRWYLSDFQNQDRHLPRPSNKKWAIRIVFLVLLQAPLLRYIDSLYYGVKSWIASTRNNSRKQLKYYELMVHENVDSALLKLFEAFMESAPQVTLQLYILMLHFNDPEGQGPFENINIKYQYFGIATSLLSLAGSLSAYNKAVRCQPNKGNISCKAFWVLFAWHLCGITSRVLALALFAVTYPLLILPFCVSHWMVMLIWVTFQQKRNRESCHKCGCEGTLEGTLLNIGVAFIYIFTFFNIREGATRHKYMIFYSIIFVENTVLLLLWFYFGSTLPQIEWLNSTVPFVGLFGNYAMFFVGLIFMVLYYKCLHPTIGRYREHVDGATLALRNRNSRNSSHSNQLSMGLALAPI